MYSGVGHPPIEQPLFLRHVATTVVSPGARTIPRGSARITQSSITDRHQVANDKLCRVLAKGSILGRPCHKPFRYFRDPGKITIDVF
jgi:hypothetical protein